MKISPKHTLSTFIILLALHGACHAANITWNGSINNDWANGSNWDNAIGPEAGDVVYINSGAVELSTGETPNFRALRVNGGTLTFSGGEFRATSSSAWDSHVEGTVFHTGTAVQINELEIGRTLGDNGSYFLSGGSLRINRGLNGNSIYLGGNKSNVNAGNGVLEINGGSLTTRASVKLGDDTLTGTGTFAVLGSAIGEIGLAASTGDNDATWLQHSGSTLKVGIDLGGVRAIFLNDSSTDTDGTSATFESGSLLDVDYYANGEEGGTWTVMEVENGDVIDNGLAFAPGVDTSIWSFSVDNSGANGLLQVTATGDLITDNVFWTGLESSDWEDGGNWSNGVGPGDDEDGYITFGNVDYTSSAGTSENMTALRMLGGTLNISGGELRANRRSSRESQIDALVIQTGGEADYNELEIGHTLGATGEYFLSGGDLVIGRALGDHSLYLGGNRRVTDGGDGLLEISGGSFTTRSAVKLGDTTRPGTGHFAVLGSAIGEIGIANSNDDNDGRWWQHAGSTLQVGIDFGGVTPIILHDSATDTDGTSATFEAGSLLDVDYYDTGNGGGTWTVMEVQNGDVIDNGLAFASGVDTSIWSFSVDNSGANGLLQVSAVGDPAGIPLVVGDTKLQQMRYGMDYERLWYWTGGLNSSERDTVAKWSVIDCDIDYLRVAINSKYELTEGTFDLSAYTSKIWPMMHEMQDANPDIKFFASPRPLNEAVDNVSWQPYPQWITGSSGSDSNFDFDWEKCAEYLERYILLMKSEGFKISYMDITNEWQSNVSGGRVTPSDVRDIAEYLEDNLDPADMPLIIAPSAWSYSQSRSWMSGVDSTRKRNAIDIAAGHNTDKTGTAQEFADRVRDVLGTEKEIWNTELHGWKSTSNANEVLTSSFMFEAIRAGFHGLSGWLAIGTTNQGHAYILNPSGSPSRNVKYFIFKKLTNSSHRGHALDINQPAEFKTTSATIKGNLMTVWVINESTSSLPVNILPTGRTISESTVRRTRWNTSLDVEGEKQFIPVTSNTALFSTIPGESLCCFEILLDAEDGSFARFEAEAHDAESGTQSEQNGDTDGTQNVGYIEDGDWARYDNITFGDDPVIRFRVARPSNRKDGWIEVRLDSPTGELIGKVAVPETGGWQDYETIETTLEPVSGTRSVYLNFVEVGSSDGNSLFNFNWFSLVQLPAPEGLATAPVSASQINLTWNAAAGATSYTIKRSTTDGGPYSPVAVGVTGTSYTDNNLTAGTRYYYVITAVYPGGGSGDSVGANSVPSDPIDLESMDLGDANIVGGQFRIPVFGTSAGWFFQLEVSDDLVGWQSIGNPILSSGGTLGLTAPISLNDRRKFYRAKIYRE